jgi:hypothetical protein
MLLTCVSEPLAAFTRMTKGGRMKTKKIIIMLLLAVALLGCGKREPRHIVIMPDVSGSIERESLEQAFKAINELAGHLQRGDRLTIIPILGDAEAEASGRILRVEAPMDRQAYDADLQNFLVKLKASLTEMQISAATHPGSQTDISGTIGLAEQEFQADAGGRRHILVVLSDLIEEDGTTNFRTAGQLRDSVAAKEFSQQLSRRVDLNFQGATVHLGLLRGNEYARLSKDRRTALKAFWMTYFSTLGSKPEFVTDGTRLLENLK